LLDSALLRAFGLPIPDKKGMVKMPRPTYRSSSDWELHSFFQCMSGNQPEGFLLGGRVFMKGMEDRNAERALISSVLTRLARMVYETPFTPDREPRDSEIAHMGAFTAAFVPGRHVHALVEWFEDMHRGIEDCGLVPQPIPIARGVLMSPFFDHAKASSFWFIAAVSRDFPSEIFSHPCMPDEGQVFSSFQCRRFGHMFTMMPDPAVRRFAAHMRDGIRTEYVWHYDEERHIRRGVIRPVDPDVRQRVLKTVLSYVGNGERYALVEELFFPRTPAPSDQLPPMSVEGG
jgi:hypothetical protein